MLSCKKATELIEKQQVTPLGWVEKIQLSSHLSMCRACSAYKTQSKKIDQLWRVHHQMPGQEIMSDAEKKELVEFLKKNL